MTYSIRAQGKIACELALTGCATRVVRAFETNGLRLRFPKDTQGFPGLPMDSCDAGFCNGVVINTGGGMASGDGAHFELRLQQGARALITSQSPEKIYRADGVSQSVTSIAADIALATDACLFWLPQETLVYDGARAARTTVVRLKQDASFFALEMVNFGRALMGEVFPHGSFSDSWRIYEENRLIHAEAFCLEGDFVERLSAPACGHGFSDAGRKENFATPHGANLEAGPDVVDDFENASAPTRCFATLLMVGARRKLWQDRLEEFLQHGQRASHNIVGQSAGDDHDAQNRNVMASSHTTKRAAQERDGVQTHKTSATVETHNTDRGGFQTHHLLWGTSHFPGKSVARFLAADPAAMRQFLMRLITHVTKQPIPRVWQ